MAPPVKEFDYKMQYRPGRVNPDAFSRLRQCDLDEDEELNDDIQAYTDFPQFSFCALAIT